MSRVLFSIPVHERPDIVRDQIENIQHFCPNATVCIHVSAAAAAQMRVFERYCDLPNVLVNPNSFETGLGTGILHTHVSNFEYSILQGVDFDKVVLLSSNEMPFSSCLLTFQTESQLPRSDQMNGEGTTAAFEVFSMIA